MYINQIRPRLYLGELTSLRYVQQRGITHILSISKEAPSIKDMWPDGNYVQLIIALDDVDSEDLLSHFQECIDFIKQGLAVENAKVLVHCIAGVSRSPTVIMAYLMQTEDMDASTARATVASLRHVVNPNDGFLAQLNVWEEMDNKFDSSHPYVKRRALQKLQELQTSGESIEKDELADPKSSVDEVSGDKDLYYRCRKCRTLVATSRNEAQEYLVQAAKDSTPKFRDKRNGKTSGGSPTAATQIFVEPMQWMDEVLEGAIQGKLYCKGCQARIGSFNWSGMQSSKGDWVTPAFELQLSRLDALPSGLNQSTQQIRKPVL